MADHKEAAKKGCDFDAKAAKAIHGKTVILMVTPTEAYALAHPEIFTDGVPVVIGGQTSLNWPIEAETTTSTTKDGDGEWSIQNAGQKSWSTSCESLYFYDDAGQKLIMDALVNGTYICIGAYRREKSGEGYKYTPLRKGMAVVTSDEFDAPADDNVTGSFEFAGSGVCWTYETASQEEIEAMTIDTGAE